MLNDDLIAYLQPAPNHFSSTEWRDVCGVFSDIRVERHRFCLRAALPPGRYRCRLETKPGTFDMKTTMIPMVRAPDGKKVLVGPFDLNHFENVMALPMARAYVNGKLKGGVWFDMPGPKRIEERCVCTDFGFEVEKPETELVLEFVERDRERIAWPNVRYMEFRKDDRPAFPLLPASKRHPRVYVTAEELPSLRRRLLAQPAFQALVEKLVDGELEMQPISDRYFDLACLAHLITKNDRIGEKVLQKVMELCRQPTWSGRPDPLLLGGDNDRGVGFKLGWVALAWEYCPELFGRVERPAILAKVDEYLNKMYDFTVLQRTYMGLPSTDPHSLGAWNGTGVACMVFHDELDIARKALAFFHGLFVDSLKLFPPGGKTIWATYFPFHLVRYLAAAHTFGGLRPELNESAYLDNLGEALLASFETPNNQELQRGLRTKEYRFISAFLSRFHPTKGIASIYQAFVERERRSAGNVEPTFYDCLYAPTTRTKAAAFPQRPYFARDIGEVIMMTKGDSRISCSFSAGIKTAGRASFSTIPHHRELAMPQMGSIDVSVDGNPVLINFNMCTFQQDSSLTNAMCFEKGGILTNHQYINGDIGPEVSSHIRRCFIGDRFVYAHAVITETLHPALEIERADRIFVMDLRTGAMVLADSFKGHRPVHFATHLHCGGSITSLGDYRYRLTGGQAGLIAGFGGDRLTNEEKGEIVVSILGHKERVRTVVEEPAWIPSYIYGINFTGKERFCDARVPVIRRWRLEIPEAVREGSFLFALSRPNDHVLLKKKNVVFPKGGLLRMGGCESLCLFGCEAKAEAMLVDEETRKVIGIGVRRLSVGQRHMEFAMPTDVEIECDGAAPRGSIFSATSKPLVSASGFHVRGCRSSANSQRNALGWSAGFNAI